MKHAAFFYALILFLLLSSPITFAQERLSVDFPNGGFERKASFPGTDGTSRLGPANCIVYSPYTSGSSYGDPLAVFEVDATEARPGSEGTSSLHIMHPPNRFHTTTQTHVAQTARSNRNLFGLTFDVEIWVRTENWWGNTNHYVQIWIMPVDSDGVTLGDPFSSDPLAMFIGPHPEDPYDGVKNRFAATSEWTLYRLENIPIEEPDTYGFYFQVSAWFNNTDTGSRVPGDPQNTGEVTGNAHVWLDDLKLVIPSGSDQTGLEDWMLH